MSGRSAQDCREEQSQSAVRRIDIEFAFTNEQAEDVAAYL
jgi:hypothetical protein